MSTISTSVPAFAKSIPPPHPLVVLLAHTDVVERTRSVRLLVHEDLVCRLQSSSPIRYHPYSRQQSSPLSSPESSEDEDSPQGLACNGQQCSAPVASLEQQSRRIRIPRPKGAGRQSLRDLLKWDPHRLDNVKTRLQVFVEQHLKKTESFKDQDQDQVQLVKNLMVEEFPFLDDYETLWPLEQLLIAKLKYSSAASKCSASRNIVEEVRDKVASTSRQAGRLRR